jgi:asparagine synthase (glutamine-hydrolysing)
LRECVGSCFSGEPTGTFLSGGLDSSTVTGVFQNLSREPVDSFAIGFDAEGFDEMKFARASASHFGANLHEYYVTPQDVLDAIPLVASAYDEPFGNASAVPAYFCAKMARAAGKSLLLAGDGGDEIFAGNARYAKQKMFELYRQVPDFFKSAILEPAAFNMPLLRKLKSYIEQAKTPMPERMEAYNFLHRSSLDEIFNKDFLNRVSSDAPLEYLSDRYHAAPPNTSLVKRMLFLDHKFTLADNDLRKVNRMCELADIEVRYPLLQDRMMDFAARVPTAMLLRRFELRSFYRRAMEGFLAKETLNKSKHGFGLPFGLWMNEYKPLKEFVDHNLEDFKKREIINERYIGVIIDAQNNGNASYFGVFIWLLLFLEQWMEANNL